MDIRSVNPVSILIRIALALLIGGLLGMERGRKNRPAGFRTYMLVCLGSTFVMLTNQYVYQTYGVSDPVRMGAQVVSGIGFLGAGTILITSRKQVKGITTAAGLWAAACIGLAIGVGFYEGAVLAGAAIFFVMTLFQRIDFHIHHSSRIMDVYIEYGCEEHFSAFINFAKANDFELSEFQITRSEAGLCVTMTVESTTKRTHADMIELLSEAPGLTHIEEI